MVTDESPPNRAEAAISILAALVRVEGHPSPGEVPRPMPGRLTLYLHWPDVRSQITDRGSLRISFCLGWLNRMAYEGGGERF